MAQVFTIMHDIDKVDKGKLFQMSECNTTRGHSLKLFKKRSLLNVRANYRKMGNFRVVQFSLNFAVGQDPRKLKSAKYFPSLSKVKAIIH